MSELYHYCSASTFESIVGTKCLWLSSLSLSNDNMEGKLAGSILETLFRRNGLTPEKATTAIGTVNLLEEQIDGLGFCLTENGDLLSQWRGYAQDGHGFSIGFSKEHLASLATETKGKTQRVFLRKVIYEQTEQEITVSPIFDQIQQAIDSGKLDAPYPPSLLTGFGDPNIEAEYEIKKRRYTENLQDTMLHTSYLALPTLFAMKNKAFQEEQEWRLVSYYFKHIDNSCDFRVANNMIVPYIRLPFLDNGTSAITEVILGPKNPTPEHVVRSALRKHGFPNVHIKRSSATYR